ncbi:aromatic-ring hydroxylase C-terminal domain-containing protein [Nocardia pneumoniae]|uniref:aromatic-ring hydroxylase C-terminal domain-containing protein n=1 Tax=Nocardia pneumoniae TaxID=228601 RepID=UPI0005946EAA|nr:hypothetical protein [Nocardia pneumoniae]
MANPTIARKRQWYTRVHGTTVTPAASRSERPWRNVDGLVDAAARRGVPLDVVDVRDDHARALYERDLVLVRPDQHVAWRGDSAPGEPLVVVDRIRGAHG